MTFKLHALAAALFLAQLSGTAAATLIPIVNHSFESPVQADGGFALSATGWTVFGASGVFNPTIGQLPQGPTDGLQVGFSNESGLGLRQNLGALVLPNTTYTLMVDLQSRGDGFPHVSTTLQLRTVVDNDLLASATFGAIGAGLNQLLTATFNSGAGPNLGENLRIDLIAGGVQSVWDNVRLDASPTTTVAGVPEPGSLALLGAALGAFGLSRRRKKA